METKQCRQCGMFRVISQFYKMSHVRYSKFCKFCISENNQKLKQTKKSRKKKEKVVVKQPLAKEIYLRRIRMENEFFEYWREKGFL